MPIKTLDPYTVDWEWTGPNEPQEEPVEPHHAWFAPFHKAAASGLVDGGKAQGSGPTTGGIVSDQS